MRKKLSLSISALLAAVLTCVGTYAQTTQKRLLALSDSARMAYDFPAALEFCQKAIRLDSTARSRYEEPLILAQNGLSMMGYCSQPAVIARKVVSLKDFFLYYPLPEGSWRPTPNQLDSTGKHLMARAVYIPDNASEIYYSANDDDGIRNIYKTTLDGDLWSAPALIGERLTSASDEIYPMLSADGQTLYFASKGLYGMGGYDLYVSHWNKDTKDWDVPVNMGFPYSSPYDDLLFMNSEDGKYSLFASNRDCPKDSVCIYVLEYDEVPVRKSIDDVDELRQLAALEVMHEGTEEEEAGGQGTEPQNESTRRYVAKLKEVRALRDSLSAYRKHMDELRTMMATADPERKENIADVIASREEELPALNEALQKAVGQLQEIEMEFLSKGIVPDERKLEAEANRTDGGNTSHFEFTKREMGPKLQLRMSSTKPKINYSFKILNEARFADSNTLPDGLVYQIKLFSQPRKASLADLKGLSPVYERKTSSGYSYAAGLFNSYRDALSNINKVKSRGFRNAEIIAFSNGQSIGVSKARNLESELSVYIVVIYPENGQSLPEEVIARIHDYSGQDLIKTVDNGAVIFKVGPFDVKAEAESLASDIRAAGENSVSVTVSR